MVALCGAHPALCTVGAHAVCGATVGVGLADILRIASRFCVQMLLQVPEQYIRHHATGGLAD